MFLAQGHQSLAKDSGLAFGLKIPLANNNKVVT